jgi:pyruvate/2-oxoglutarate dehydrogenase complex dihydrolipoamide acyltransferase (E2) component
LLNTYIIYSIHSSVSEMRGTLGEASASGHTMLQLTPAQETLRYHCIKRIVFQHMNVLHCSSIINLERGLKAEKRKRVKEAEEQRMRVQQAEEEEARAEEEARKEEVARAEEEEGSRAEEAANSPPRGSAPAGHVEINRRAIDPNRKRELANMGRDLRQSVGSLYFGAFTFASGDVRVSESSERQPEGHGARCRHDEAHI